MIFFKGKVTGMKDVKERGKFLSEEFGMDSHQTRKIWCFGPSTSGPNMLMDVTKSCQNLHEVKDTVVAGFQWATEEVCLTSLQARVDFILSFLWFLWLCIAASSRVEWKAVYCI